MPTYGTYSAPTLSGYGTAPRTTTISSTSTGGRNYSNTWQPGYVFDFNTGKFYDPNAAGSVTSGGGAGNLTGQSTTTGSAALGYKPLVPDPTATAANAIKGNLTNLTSATDLANQITNSMQANRIGQITNLYPQFNANTAQSGANISNWAQGRISDSTTNALSQAAAERGAMGGFGPVSPNSNAAFMRLIGQTSEGLQQQAISGQNALLSGLPTTTPTNPSSFMVSPDAQYNAQLLANIYAASPDPNAAYTLAAQNALSGLSQGQIAARPTGSGASAGTSNLNDLGWLDNLINRTSGSARPSVTTSAQQTYSAPVGDTLEGLGADYALYGSDPNNLFGGDYTGDMGYSTSPEEADWLAYAGGIY